MIDHTTVRYVPGTALVVKNGKYGEMPVKRFVVHPPNQHPKGCPLVEDCTAIELVTDTGSRWWGCERAWINSELRMVATGFDMRNELVNKWEICTTV